MGSPEGILLCKQKIISSEEHNFITWLTKRGEDEACACLSIGMSKHGRGLFAIKPIWKGESILRISEHMIITPDKLHDEVRDFLPRDFSDRAQLALLILAEQHANTASEWAPYINCLPKLGSLNNTVLWYDEELEFLSPSSKAYYQSTKSRAAILDEFAAVQHVLQNFPHIFGENVSNSSFQHACSVVNSRAWGIDELDTIGLVPFVDFLNHDVACKSFLTFDNGYAEVVADRDYASGEEVLINYGKFGNEVLATTFGFTVEDNPYDQVEVWMEIPCEDVLHVEKLQLLHSHGMLTSNDIRNIDRVGGYIFVVKEVKTVKGHGKGIPQSMRAFSRVLCAVSKEELIDMENEALETDGRLARRPLKDKYKELKAMKLLLTTFTLLIKDYTAALMAIQVENYSKRNWKLTVHRKMSEDILRGELRILQSAAEWLENHCTELVC